MIQTELTTKGAIVLEIKTGKKKVIGNTIPFLKVYDNPTEYDYLGDRPHFDGDYSYICGSNYCKCMQ